MDKDLLEFLQAFREETTRRFDEMEERFTGRVDEMEQRFTGRVDEMEEHFTGHVDDMEQRLDGRIDQMGQHLDGRIDVLRNETTQRLDALGAEVRGAYVLVEDLRGNVQMVAEGVTGVTEKLQKHGEEVSKRFDKLESFTRRSYRELDTRVRRLEGT